ncbi:MAG: HTH domain-containing protein [Gilliamella sp.]|nr:HTH domain-containing protein [Gilliamella sp.]
MLNIKRQILIALLNQKKGLRSSDLAQQLDVTPRTIRNNITELNRSLQGKVIGYRRTFLSRIINYTIQITRLIGHF